MRPSIVSLISRKVRARQAQDLAWSKVVSKSILDGKQRKSTLMFNEDGDKTGRKFHYPHIVKAASYSHTLGKNVKLDITTSALRTIDKYGGLDNYLLKRGDEFIGPRGIELREKIKQIQANVIAQRNGQAAATTTTTTASSSSSQTPPASTTTTTTTTSSPSL